MTTRLDIDEFGHDPQVRFLRRAFAETEAAQGDLLKRLDISPLDGRLRSAREATLKLFGRIWEVYDRWGTAMDEKEMSYIYLHCFYRILEKLKMAPPEGILPPNERMEKLMREVDR